MYQCNDVTLSEFRYNPHVGYNFARINIFLNRKECYIATRKVTHLKMLHNNKKTCEFNVYKSQENEMKNSNIIHCYAHRTLTLNVIENARISYLLRLF